MSTTIITITITKYYQRFWTTFFKLPSEEFFESAFLRLRRFYAFSKFCPCLPDRAGCDTNNLNGAVNAVAGSTVNGFSLVTYQHGITTRAESAESGHPLLNLETSGI